jgi:hypothetical protein
MNLSYKFEIEENGTVFECERRVEGVDVLRQHVFVAGFGEREDPARYGKKTRTGGMMQSVAVIIARQMVREKRR